MIRVLLVDDQALFRAGIRMLVSSQADMEVVGEAGDGQEALAVVAEVRPDVVLMDIRMPVMDGLTATAEILREADAIYLDEIRKAGLYDAIWQAFAVLLPVQTVGVMGDGRTYEFVCALRAVTSVDGMTADFYHYDMEFLGRAATRIINEVRGINRVVYDVTSKPPGTIEWE